MPSSLGFELPPESGPDQSIAPLPTARTAFIGRTLRGPVNRVTLIKSFAEFAQIFGGLWQPSTLGYAVEQFFDNGGREALIVRVENGARPATLDLGAGGERLRLCAVRPGTREFLRACVDYDHIPADRTSDFNLTVQRVRLQGTLRVEDQEIFANLSLQPDSPRHLPAALARSELIRVAGPLPARRPDLTPDPASGLATGYVPSNCDGDDGGPLSDYDLIGSVAERTGLFAFGAADQFNFLCIPPIARDRDVSVCTLLVAARLCRARHALLLVDPPRDWATADEALAALRDWDFRSEDALMFFPRILAHDKLRGRFETFAPSGAVAGMLARWDEAAPPWTRREQPVDLVLRQGFRPNCLVPDDRRLRLGARGVNSLQSLRTAVNTAPPLCTLVAVSAAAAERRSLRSRRLALHVLGCIEHGTRWTVTAPRPDAGAVVEAQVRAFLERLHAEGAFGECSAGDAYFVTTQLAPSRPAPGQFASSEPAPAQPDFQLLVGLAAARLGEFHSYRICHTSAGSTVRPVTLNRLNNLRYSPGEIEWADRLAEELRH